jgi:hypothetical protein
LSVVAAAPIAAGTKDRRDDVRVFGVCSGATTSTLRLKSKDGGIELRFEVEDARRGSAWRVVLVQERRIAWKGTVKTRGSGSFEVRRALRDLPGADVIAARALGPRGLVCRATATLPASESL